MLGRVLLLVLVVLEHGEVDDPQKLMTLARHVQALGHVQAQRRENRVGDGGLVGGEQKQVARLDAHGLLQTRVDILLEELDDGALLVAVGRERDPGHALRAVGSRDVGELLDVATRPVACALAVDGLHHAARVDGLGEHAEAAAAHDLGEIHQLHAEARVGTIATEALHGLGVLHALQRELMLDACGGKRLGHDVLHHVHDVFALHERHLDVNLRELRLTVGAGPRRGSSGRSGSNARRRRT